MKPRQDMVEMFADFLRLDQNFVQGWISDPKLRRSMQRHLAEARSNSDNSNSDKVWALYWHQIWQTEASTLATAHLAAYVQESCYWAARKVLINSPIQQSLADLFQTAIASLPKVLKSFNPQLGFNFKSYAERSFSNVIKDSLRQSQEVNICSDWSLLHKVSQKRLVEALHQAGLSAAKIAAYALAWRCYQELYTAEPTGTTRQLARPEAHLWGAIANLFNQQSPSPAVTPDHLEKWLIAMAKAIRAYQSPTIISANTPRPGQETGELLDSLPAASESLLQELIEQETAAHRQTQTAAMNDQLTAAIGQLDPEWQTLLQVYYGQALTQQEIAQQLNLKQYTISRRLTTIRGKLLRVLATWAQDHLHVELTPSVLDSMNALLEEWLTEKSNPHPIPPIEW
jgi:RNA polymerase sigma factor (sigma-70 family)